MTAALLSSAQISTIPTIEEGEAGVILKRDGTFAVFNTHRDLDPTKLTQEQIEQGKILLGLSAALKIPALMQVLINAATDTELFPEAVEMPARN